MPASRSHRDNVAKMSRSGSPEEKPKHTKAATRGWKYAAMPTSGGAAASRSALPFSVFP